VIRRRGLPAGAEQIIQEHLAHWPHLDAAERARLLSDTDWLLRRKHWEAAAGFALDDTIRVVIASQAALLILGLSTDHYRLVSSIIVYPAAAMATGERAGPVPGTRTDEPMAIHGLAQDRRGPILVSWDQAMASARHPERGHNVVFHEFAHKLDMLDGIIDGTPPIGSAAMRPWVRVCTEVFLDLRAGNPRPPLRGYGATNPAEFFAVATEAFFDTAAELRANEPALYDILAGFYRQDPAARSPKPGPV
jgi:Mlc titration factor MtfA (ptsG expression regulator)